MDIYAQFDIIEEKAFTNLLISKGEYCSWHLDECTDCEQGVQKNITVFTDVTEWAAIEFKIDNFKNAVALKDTGSAPQLTGPLAHVIRWNFNEKAEQVWFSNVLDKHGTLEFGNFSSSSIVVRILKKKEAKNEQDPYIPPNSPEDALAVKIGEKQIVVSAQCFSSVSPMVSRMLSSGMEEQQQRLINLGHLEINMDQFMEFLDAIFATFGHMPTAPTPKNVLTLLHLSDYFQIDWLKKRCEKHLINCVEIPLLVRFQLIEKYGLNNLKNYFLHMNVDFFRAFFKANCAVLLPSTSFEFMEQLIKKFL